MKKKLLAFVLTLTLCLSCGMTAFASSVGGSGTGDDGPAPTMQIVGGPSYTKTGWLVYLVDWTGSQVSDTQVIYEYQTPNCNLFYPKTHFGGTINYNNYEIGSPWGLPPFDANQRGYGSAVKSWMLQKTDDTYNCLRVIDKYFGPAAAESFANEECMLICEGLYWSQMYRDDIGATGIYLCAGSYGWADMNERIGTGPYGSKAIGRYTNHIYPNCVRLDTAIYFSERIN